ncbi:MAG: Hsp20/alpha crystallin family protein [Planctomycetia bacterium]|nr:MAG: Hsp20/alpha crystallin family protein [Planctomycetia bacterium]
MNTQSSIQKCETACTPERARAGRTYRPNVDIVERPDELLLIADVPGARAENVDIQYENGVLTLNVTVPDRFENTTGLVMREYGVGDFARTFQLGDGIDNSKIHAQCADGVLTVHLPKAEKHRARKIAVKG